MTITITPEHIDVQNWAAQNLGLLNRFGTVGPLTDPDQWRSWAQSVATIPDLSALGCPHPTGFATWQDWARAFNVAARLLQT